MIKYIYNYLNHLLIVVILSISGIAKAQIIELVPFIKNNLWGYCDTSLRVKIAPQFDLASPFDANGLAIVYKRLKGSDTIKILKETTSNSVGNEANDIIITPTYRCNLIDQTGKIILKDWYDHILERGQSYSLVNFKRKINDNVSTNNPSEYLSKIGDNNTIKNCSIIDTKGNIIRTSNGLNYLLENNIIVNETDNKQTLYNINGDAIWKSDNLKIIGFSNGHYLAINDTAYFLLNEKFEIKQQRHRNADKSSFTMVTEFIQPFHKSMEYFPSQEQIFFHFNKFSVDPVRKNSWHYIKSESTLVNEFGEIFYDNSYGFIDSTGTKFLELNEKQKIRFSNGFSSIKSSFCQNCYEYLITSKGKKVAFKSGIGNQGVATFSPLKNFIGTYKYGLTLYYSVSIDDENAGDQSSFSTLVGFMDAHGKIYIVK